jgi:gluconolactonase
MRQAMKKLSIGVLSVMLLGLHLASAQAPAPPTKDSPFRIVKMDSALDAIVDPEAKLETLGEHFALTEGPLWIPAGNSGYLIFSDVAANVIYKRTPDGRVTVFLEKSGFSGNDAFVPTLDHDPVKHEVLNVGQQTISGRMAIVLIGSNGLALDPQGRVVITAMADRNVTRLEKDGTRTVLADRYEGKRFSGPNDVVVKSNGAVYFTDSVNGLRGGPKGPLRELSFNGFYLVKDGKVTLLGGEQEPGGGPPNGITFSPDEKYLYVSAGRTVRRYQVQPDDTVTSGETFIPDAGSDGMKVDQRGNLYTTGGGGGAVVRITSPEGKHLGTLQLPVLVEKEPRARVCSTNVAFGDPDNRGLYITACTHLFKIRLKTPGVRPGQK